MMITVAAAVTPIINEISDVDMVTTHWKVTTCIPRTILCGEKNRSTRASDEGPLPNLRISEDPDDPRASNLRPIHHWHLTFKISTTFLRQVLSVSFLYRVRILAGEEAAMTFIPGAVKNRVNEGVGHFPSTLSEREAV